MFRLIAFILVSVVTIVGCNGGTSTLGSEIKPTVAATIEGTLPPTPTPTPTLTPTATSPAGFDVYFIDVGQGDSTLIIASSGESLLLDGGGSKFLIRNRLQRLGISDLDAIAMTHPHADHIAGLIEVLALYEIERIYLNGGWIGTQTFSEFMIAVNEEGSEVTTVTRGDTILLGDLAIQVLHPGDLIGDPNDDSMVLLLNCGQVEVLLTGDATAESEDEMIRSGVLADVDVLKVGHHGSGTSTSQPFLDLVRPDIAVISAGLDNQYRHPHQEVLDRLDNAGSQIWLTDVGIGDDTLHLNTNCRTFTIG
jgi:competence protein ComEC